MMIKESAHSPCIYGPMSGERIRTVDLSISGRWVWPQTPRNWRTVARHRYGIGLRKGIARRHQHSGWGPGVAEIPKLRTGSFFPNLLERRRRVDQSLFAVITEA
jgi:hypothetical protein